MEEKKLEDIKNPKNILEYDIPDKKIKKVLYDWLRKLSIEKSFSKYTVNSYETDLRNFINFLCWYKKNKNIDLSILKVGQLRKIKEEDFDYKKIDLNINELINIQYQQIRPYLFFLDYLNYEKKSTKRIVASIKSFYKFLNNNDEIGYKNIKIDPRILSELKGPKAEKNLPRPIKEEDIWRIIDKINLSYKVDWIKKRDIALIYIIWGTGLRIGETLSIKYHQIPISSSKCIIRIIAKGKKDKDVFLLPVVITKIKEYINSCPLKFESESFLFVDVNLDKLHPSIFERNFRKIGKKLGLYKLDQVEQYKAYKCECSEYKGIEYKNKKCEKCETLVKERTASEHKKDDFGPHALRHSFASHLLDNNVDLREIQKMMGHASIKNTQIYTEINDKKLHEQYIKFNPRNKINIKN